MIHGNQVLALLPALSGKVEQLAAQPRAPKFTAPPKGSRIGYADIVGVVEPGYMALVRRDLLRMAADPTVHTISLYIDSPGGTSAGSAELSEVVRRVAKAKPVHVFAENYCCSAGYMIASGATSITASPTALVGSIGTYIVVVDDSEMFERLGVKVLKIASGPNKGAGIPGVKVEDEHIAMFRRLVDVANNHFMVAVMRGRGFSADKMLQLSTGEVWWATSAKNLGLVDRLAIYEDWLAEIKGEHPPEQFVDIRGYDAVQKVCELAGQEWFEDIPKKSLVQLRGEYPTLIAAAESYDPNR